MTSYTPVLPGHVDMIWILHTYILPGVVYTEREYMCADDMDLTEHTYTPAHVDMIWISQSGSISVVMCDPSYTPALCTQHVSYTPVLPGVIEVVYTERESRCVVM